MNSIDLHEKFTMIDDCWSPRIIAAANGQEFKLVRLHGEFDWHAHEEADEVFLVLSGQFTMEFRDRNVDLTTGQLIVVPRGVEHRPVAQEMCEVMLCEPEGLTNTGDGEPTDRTKTAIWI